MLTIEESQRVWSQQELRKHLVDLGLSDDDIDSPPCGRDNLPQSVKWMTANGDLTHLRTVLANFKSTETISAANAAVRIEVELANGEVWSASGSDARAIWEELTGAQVLMGIRSGKQYTGPILKVIKRC